MPQMRMNSLKSLAMNWGPLSEMIRGLASGNFACPLQDGRHVVLGHRFADLPMSDVTAVAIQDAAHVVERSGDVEVADIHMPVFVGLSG